MPVFDNVFSSLSLSPQRPPQSELIHTALSATADTYTQTLHTTGTQKCLLFPPPSVKTPTPIFEQGTLNPVPQLSSYQFTCNTCITRNGWSLHPLAILLARRKVHGRLTINPSWWRWRKRHAITSYTSTCQVKILWCRLLIFHVNIGQHKASSCHRRECMIIQNPTQNWSFVSCFAPKGKKLLPSELLFPLNWTLDLEKKAEWNIWEEISTSTESS